MLKWNDFLQFFLKKREKRLNNEPSFSFFVGFELCRNKFYLHTNLCKLKKCAAEATHEKCVPRIVAKQIRYQYNRSIAKTRIFTEIKILLLYLILLNLFGIVIIACYIPKVKIKLRLQNKNALHMQGIRINLLCMGAKRCVLLF